MRTLKYTRQMSLIDLVTYFVNNHVSYSKPFLNRDLVNLLREVPIIKHVYHSSELSDIGNEELQSPGIMSNLQFSLLDDTWLKYKLFAETNDWFLYEIALSGIYLKSAGTEIIIHLRYDDFENLFLTSSNLVLPSVEISPGYTSLLLDTQLLIDKNAMVSDFLKRFGITLDRKTQDDQND